MGEVGDADLRTVLKTVTAKAARRRDWRITMERHPADLTTAHGARRAESGKRLNVGMGGKVTKSGRRVGQLSRGRQKKKRVDVTRFEW